MLKQILSILGIILLSIIIVLTMLYVQQALQFVISIHEWISELLVDVFSGGETGNLIRKSIALLALPLLVGFIPAIVYLVFKRQWFANFMTVVWVVWLIQASVLVIQYK